MAYRLSGFHVWDVTNLDAVKERLHLPSIGPVLAATILPDVNSSAMLVGSGTDTTLSIYSLETHAMITRVSVPHAQTLQANSRFICIGVNGGTASSTDSAIHIMSAKPDYPLLYTIPSSSLAPTTTPTFALSQARLLAYAAAPPPTHRQQQQQQQSPPTTSSYPPSNVFTSSSAIPPSTSPLASSLATGMAVVGSGMLSGAKILGSGVLKGVEMGMNVAGYRATTATTTATVTDGSIPERGDLFSRSAPTGNASPLSSRGHSRRASGNVHVRSAVSNTGVSSSTGTGMINEGSWITIVDLQSLIPSSSTSSNTLDAESADGVFMYPPPHRSSSFHANIPALRTLSTPAQSNSPQVLTEFQYAAASPSGIPSSLRTLGRYSPGSVTLGRYSPGGSGTSTLAPLVKASTGTSSSVVVGSGAGVGAESITTMKWNAEGTTLAVGGSEGGSVKVFKISWRAKSRIPSTDGAKEANAKMTSNEAGANVGLAFEMLRGVSPASIKGIEWSESGLWSGFISGNGTLRELNVTLRFYYVVALILIIIIY